MHFSKKASTLEEQLKLLKDRGMSISDPDHAKRCLSTIGYYRLSAYWLPFEEPAHPGTTRSKKFGPSTEFEQIYELYVFDRKLRVLIMEAVERIEIHIRSRWTNRMTLEHGPHAHLDHSLFANDLKHAKQLLQLANSVEKSNETFVEHYKSKYRTPYSPPLWAATELMTLGELSKWIVATEDYRIRDKVSKDLGLPTKETFESVLQVMSYVRNICAHHGRLWNRRLVKRIPKIKRFREDLIFEEVKGQSQPQNLIYNVLVVILHLLHRQNTDTTFPDRLRELMNTIDPKYLNLMGFPDDWEARPAWNLVIPGA